jgi:DNA-binding transcriptional ArsR family regulator
VLTNEAIDGGLRALAEPNRRHILRLVWDEELAAGEVAAHFDLTRQAVSLHLRVLAESGLVNARRDGTRRLYRAERGRVEEIQEELARFWSSGLARLKERAEDGESTT